MTINGTEIKVNPDGLIVWADDWRKVVQAADLGLIRRVFYQRFWGHTDYYVSSRAMGHTPGLCGCRLDPVADDGIGWQIVYCPLHAKAPEMLDSLKSFVKLTDEAEAQARWPSGPWLHFCAARALLAELGEGA